MGSLRFDGRSVPFADGDTVASALYRDGVRTFNRSLKYHRRRGLYCATGDCPNCLVNVDGEPGVRSCVTQARPGMQVRRETGWPGPERDALAVTDRLHWAMPVSFYSKTFIRPRWAWGLVERVIRRATGIGRLPVGAPVTPKPTRHARADVVVIGAGLAGLAAAGAAARDGARVVLCDEGTPGWVLADGPLLERVSELANDVRSLAGVDLLERHTAIGIYEGPSVVVIGPDEMVEIEAGRVIVATGAVDAHGIFPGNDLPGIWLGRGAARMVAAHGVPIGRRVVVAADTEEGLQHAAAIRATGAEVVLLCPEDRGPDGIERLPGARVLLAHGSKQLAGVTVSTSDGKRRLDCDALVLSLGLSPRDTLLRMGTADEVTGAGDVVWPGCTADEAERSGRLAGEGREVEPREPSPWPALAEDGTVCLCEDVGVHELSAAWDEGWTSTEILKRYTTATMGPCQGAMCGRHLACFAEGRGAAPAAGGRTTARPPVRSPKLEDLIGGIHEVVDKRTALHERHVAAGARIDRSGVWLRPGTYRDTRAEYLAVREGVGVMDVSTLGKFLVAGRDARALLDRVFPGRIEDLAPGRARYLLALDEAGYVIDDGLVAALERGYYVTSTSGGAERMEAWLRNWADRLGLHVHVVDQTAQLGAINVAGPSARDLLARLSDDDLSRDAVPYPGHAEVTVAGVGCRAIAAGFVGELSFELHHPRSRSLELWDALLEAGRDLGVRPHGLDALDLLRMEKGHIYLAQDTLPDDHPAKLGMSWAVAIDKPWFVGKASLERMASLPLERRLVGLRFDGDPQRGMPLEIDGRVIGRVTSCGRSPALGFPIGLGWLRAVDGAFPATLRAGSATATVVPTPFYDPEGVRLRA